MTLTLEHLHCMNLAESTSVKSNCQRAKVGCVVKRGDNIATGYNHNVNSSCECDQGITRDDTTHAEIAALANNTNWTDATAYITRRPCLPCAKRLYARGVKTIYLKNVGSKTEGIDYLLKKGCLVYEGHWIDQVVQQSWDQRWGNAATFCEENL